MSVQVEKLEKNMAKLTVEVPAEEVEKALQAAYMKEKNKISIPGFRKGKVPRAMIEKMYGAAVFYEEAANILIQDNYAAAMEESKEDIVSRPTIDVVQIESGKPFIFTAEVAVRPEVTLGKYKGVQVTKIDTTVTDEEVEAALEKEQQKNSRTVTVTDRPVANGDTAVIDFEGFVDGVAFEGGKGENHPLEIGSHSFIDTFEDQLVGHNAGDEVEVNVTFPEKYQAADLAGKPAVFKVKINEIKTKELPELNDEFASEVSEFDTLAEYKEDLRKHLEVEKENEAKRTKEDEAIKKIIDKSTMEIPEAMIETQCENMINEFAQRIAQSGLSKTGLRSAGAGRRLPRAGRQALAAGRTQRRPALRRLGQGPCAFGRTAQLVSRRPRGPLGGVPPPVHRRAACVAGRAGVRPRNRRCGHGDAALRLEKCGGEPCAHPAGVFAESCRRGYNRVIFAIFASPCPGSGWKTMISAS